MKSALVLGSAGGLGGSVVEFYQRSKWNVIGADVVKNATATPSDFCLLNPKSPTTETAKTLINFVGERKISAIVNVAGGWAGGSICDPSVCDDAELMIQQSVFSSVAASKVFAATADKNSLLVLTGAAAALGPTPSMIGYGMAKSSVHFLTKSLAEDLRLREMNARIVCVLPVTLDTKGNRNAMPDADRSSWTPLKDIASQILKWSNGSELPSSGSLMKVETLKGKTTFTLQT